MPVSYAAIDALETEWLWEGRIPRGEVTMIAGAGAVGKGQLLCDLTARVSTGRPMPLCEPAEGEEAPEIAPASVILVTPEDDPEETMSWRLRAAGADLGKVFDLTVLEGGAPFELPGAVPALRALIDDIGDVRLVVIDPLMAAVSRSISTNLAARRVMAPLMRMVKETGVACVMVHHTVKSGQIAGSKALTDVLRYNYTVTKDPENEAIRCIRLVKGNNVREQDDVRYTLVDGEHGAPRVVWLSREELTDRRTAWREKLPGRQACKATAPPLVPVLQQATAAGHAPGPASQCPDCAPGGGTDAPLTSVPPVPPAAAWNAFTIRPGGKPERLVGSAAEDMAKLVCQAKAGQALTWQADGRGGWFAVAGGLTFALAPIPAAARAV